MRTAHAVPSPAYRLVDTRTPRATVRGPLPFPVRGHIMQALTLTTSLMSWRGTIIPCRPPNGVKSSEVYRASAHCLFPPRLSHSAVWSCHPRLGDSPALADPPPYMEGGVLLADSSVNIIFHPIISHNRVPTKTKPAHRSEDAHAHPAPFSPVTT